MAFDPFTGRDDSPGGPPGGENPFDVLDPFAGFDTDVDPTQEEDIEVGFGEEINPDTRPDLFGSNAILSDLNIPIGTGATPDQVNTVLDLILAGTVSLEDAATFFEVPLDVAQAALDSRSDPFLTPGDDLEEGPIDLDEDPVDDRSDPFFTPTDDGLLDTIFDGSPAFPQGVFDADGPVPTTPGPPAFPEGTFDSDRPIPTTPIPPIFSPSPNEDDTVPPDDDGFFGIPQGVIDFVGGGVSTALGINQVQNQFDFLERSAEDQIDVNRQAGFDTSILSNPDFVNQFGSRTTTGGEIDPATGLPTRPLVTDRLSPGQQSLFDVNLANQQALGGITGNQLGQVQEAFGSPLDTSGFLERFRPEDGFGAGLFDFQDPTAQGRSEVTNALIEREQPRFDRARQAQENDLLVRGFNPDTEAFGARADEFNRAENDFRLAATLAGGQEQERLANLSARQRGQQVNERLDFGEFASTERARELQEALGLRQLPLNELNALRTGSQATIPSFQPFAGTGFSPADVTPQGLAQAGAAGGLATDFFDLATGFFGR